MFASLARAAFLPGGGERRSDSLLGATPGSKVLTKNGFARHRILAEAFLGQTSREVSDRRSRSPPDGRLPRKYSRSRKPVQKYRVLRICLMGRGSVR